MKHRAYSYKRFSSSQQQEGGSLKRQTDLAAAYCKRHSLTLDTSLSLDDLGVSAFRGDNVKEGALAGFLEACRMGRVPKGSYLLVESLDRLSRDQIRPALQLFLALQDFGVTIVTFQPEREYPPDNQDALALIEPLIVFARAHEESAMKSHRRKDGWRQARDKARAEGTLITSECPAWLTVEDGKFLIHPIHAATVKRIFGMCIDGLGVYRIAQTLTREGVPAIGDSGKWATSYLHRILRNPATMGTYQPKNRKGRVRRPDGDPIPDYYPAVVSSEEYAEAQDVMQSRFGGRGAGRVANDVNLFAKITFCAVTKRPMCILTSSGRRPANGSPPRLYTYLAPARDTATRSTGSIDHKTFEAAVLTFLRELRPADVLEHTASKACDDRDAEIAMLAGSLVKIDSRLATTQERARTAEDFDAFLGIVETLHKQRKEVASRLDELRRDKKSDPSADLGETQSLIGLLEKKTGDERADIRRRLKARIRAIVSEIWVLVQPYGKSRAAHVQLHLRAGGMRSIIVCHPKPFEVEPLPPRTNLKTYAAKA